MANEVKRVGFIGFGSMGSMLVEGLLQKGVLSPDLVSVSTRTTDKLKGIKEIFPGIHITISNCEVAQFADYLFICVKPLDFLKVINEVKPHLSAEKHIVSIAGPVKIDQIEAIVSCQISKVIPAITSLVYDGISLVCHSSKVSEQNRKYIESLLGFISTVKPAKEEQMALATELTSCAPGFFASILNEFIESVLSHEPEMRREDAEEMVVRTMAGTMKLVLEKQMSLEAIIARVATKGGITEEGVKVFERTLPPVFDEMFDVTLEKRRIVEEKVQASF